MNKGNAAVWALRIILTGMVLTVLLYNPFRIIDLDGVKIIEIAWCGVAATLGAVLREKRTQ